jgi:hypothetical protein
VVPNAFVYTTTPRTKSFTCTTAHNSWASHILHHLRPPCVPVVQRPRLRSFASSVTCAPYGCVRVSSQ